jgi:ectoine hydroxylase
VTVRTIETSSRTASYQRDGWYQAPEPLGPDVVGAVRSSVERISRQRRPEVVHERDGWTVRAIHGCHRFDDVCARLVRMPTLAGLAETLLGGPVYVYQFKVNLKQPFEGAAWPWHQDYSFWRREDGMLTPDAVNIAVFLDDVHADNGPLQVIPGSHRFGLLDSGPSDDLGAPSGDWRRHVSTDLEYTVPDDRVAALLAEYGRHVATGPAGSCVAFHPSIVHSSSNNLSPDRRAVLLITYNSVLNAPTNLARPEFLVDRDSTAVVPLPEDLL